MTAKTEALETKAVANLLCESRALRETFCSNCFDRPVYPPPKLTWLKYFQQFSKCRWMAEEKEKPICSFIHSTIRRVRSHFPCFNPCPLFFHLSLLFSLPYPFFCDPTPNHGPWLKDNPQPCRWDCSNHLQQESWKPRTMSNCLLQSKFHSSRR